MNIEKFKYREDIDGLRAVAVLLVLMFHAFPNLVTGGFIGVDVFFVISGYLITGIYLREDGSVLKKFGGFYSRRVRRIFPALIVVLYSVFFLGWNTLYATELAQLGLHILGGSGFFLNIIYEYESGYFDTLSSKKILLHLWSLSVEEQFYLIWPLFLTLGIIFKNHKKILFLLISISFLTCAIASFVNQEFAYYSLVTRFWQIGAGGMLAIYLFEDRSPTICEKVKTWGTPLLFILVWFSLSIDRQDVYPGYLSIIPVVITLGLLCQFSPGTIYWRLVSAKLMVYIGRISYPLYLWHWPIFAYMEYLDPQFANAEHRVGAIICSFIFSIITYEIIEKNLKKIKSIIVVPTLISLLIIIGYIGLNAFQRKGYEFRERNSIYKSSTPQVHVTADCLKLHEEFKKITFCRIDDIDNKVDVVLVGDSHAHQYFSSIAAGYRELGFNLLNIGWAGRKPLVYENTIQVSEHSREMSDMINKYINLDGVKVFILAFAQPKDLKEDFNNQLQFTVRKLQSAGKKVIYIEDNPNLGYSPVDCIGFPPLRPPIKENCILDYRNLPSSFFDIKEKIHSTMRQEGALIYDYSNLLCPGGVCNLLSGGKLLYEESGYISQDTAKVVMKDFPYRYGL
jgi:peptidoglycan/LPS O-acetylase OafA/YrhL